MAKTTKPADNTRVLFTEQDSAVELPNLIAHQIDSWKEFVETGLGEIFAEINPISDYTEQKLELRFKDYHFEDPKISEAQARYDNISYVASLKAAVVLRRKVSADLKGLGH